MKIAFISTINSLEKISSKGDILFCLAPYCVNKKYKEYFQYSNKYIIMDDSIAENGGVMNTTDIVNLAIEMKVNEIIIPDFISNYKKTKKMREDFLDKYYLILHKAGIKIQSVIQGNNIDEYEENLRELHKDFRVDVIGVPFRMNYTNFNNKTKEENNMLNRLLFLNTFLILKPVHCLGCNLMEEIKRLSYINVVRSIDTKLLSRYGLNNKMFKWEDKVKPKKKLYVDKDLTDKQIKLTIQNINRLQKEVEEW